MPLLTDPTLEPDMVELRERVLGQDFVQEYLEELRSRSIGLVLAGGGGKGAYEGGVLLALLDCELCDYEAIAGTSVGALNAALAHQLFRTKDRGVVAGLWGNLSPSRVLSLNPFRTSLGFLMRIGLYLSAVPVYVTSHLVALLESKRSARSNLWLGALYRAEGLAVLVPFALVMAVVSLGLVVISGWPLEFDFAFNVSLGVILAAGAFLKIRDAVGRRLSLASNAPLQQTIRESVKIGPLRKCKPPVYCTMARETTWWDPFEASEWSHVSDGAKRRGRAPVYYELGEAKSDEEAIAWLLQTAALPEIFPRKPIRGEYALDGGLLDNVPIYPVAEHYPDRIIVVYLNHKLSRNEWFYSDEASRTWWMAEFKASSEVDTRRKANEVRRRQVEKHGPIGEARLNLVPQEPRLLTREQFLPIVPSKSLGTLLTYGGTLNFGAKKARRLLRLGYCDALLWIEGYAKYYSAAPTNSPL